MTDLNLLAYHDELIRQHKALSADAYHVQELPKAEAARRAVVELVEALREAKNQLDTLQLLTPQGRRWSNERVNMVSATRLRAEKVLAKFD